VTTRNAETFTRAATALYGGHFRLPLSADLKCSERSVRRWISGSSPIPEGVWNEMRALCLKRAGELKTLAMGM
jgi:hypothetical protein